MVMEEQDHVDNAEPGADSEAVPPPEPGSPSERVLFTGRGHSVALLTP